MSACVCVQVCEIVSPVDQISSWLAWNHGNNQPSKESRMETAQVCRAINQCLSASKEAFYK